MRILITGIKGFLGGNIAKHFTKQIIYGLDLLAGKEGDIQIFASNDLDRINVKFDYVIICHAAVSSGDTKIDIKTLFNTNVELTAKILEKYINIPTIYISTASIYDKVDVIKETTKIKPVTNYAISKYWAEFLVLQNPKATILRLPSLYGIGMKENTLIPNYINQGLIKKEIEVWGNGSRLQNYIHVNDVFNVIELIIAKKKLTYGKILLAVDKKEYTNYDIAKRIADFTKSKIKFINIDNSPSNVYDNSFTRNILEWEPKESLDKELIKYIKWKQKKF